MRIVEGSGNGKSGPRTWIEDIGVGGVGIKKRAYRREERLKSNVTEDKENKGQRVR